MLNLSSTTWMALWLGLGAMTVLLVVLLRTRWSNARPLRKCAILSLWVHVLLALAATTVRIVSGAPELGSDAPIRITVRTVVEKETPLEKISPDWEQPTEATLVAPQLEPPEPPKTKPAEPGPDAATLEQVVEVAVKPEPPQPAPPWEAPSLLASPEPAEEAPAAEPQEKTPVDSLAELSTEPQEAEPTEQPQPPGQTPPTDTTATTTATTTEAESLPPAEIVPALPSTYADRFAENREQLAEQRGGSPQTERAVRAALGWLASAQAKNGGWDASNFGAGQERVVLGHNRNRAGRNADTGITGLALLAFLGSGHTHRQGPYARVVAEGLEYLRQRQRADGSLQGDAQLYARMYCHSMATFAVCEAFAITGDTRLEPMARAAVGYTLSMQHPTDGGWRYRRGDTGDTSQLGWQLMTLKSAQLAGIEIPQTTWTRVERFLRRVRRGPTGGLAAYRPAGPPSQTMTAEALFCRQLLDAAGLDTTSQAATLEATDSILQQLPSTTRRNLYFWYYASLALHRAQYQSAEVAVAWQDWNQALTTTLLSTQQAGGSWSEATVWGGYGGRVYTTALSAMCLEVYYRYSPNEGPREIAGRKGWQAVHR